MNDIKANRIARVIQAGEYKLRLRWVSGKTMVVDLSQPVHRLKGMRPLRDQAVFARAAKGEGGTALCGRVRLTWALTGSGKCRSSRMGLGMPWSSTSGAD
jgi:hypothetical protein